MCGRFCIAATIGEIQERFFLSSIPEVTLPAYNISILQSTPVIIKKEETEISLISATWGYHPKKSRNIPTIHNLRAENLKKTINLFSEEEPLPCLIPASGFFEWKQVQNRKVPYYITRKDGDLFAMAGIVAQDGNDKNRTGLCYVILTCPAEEPVRSIHDRMPVIVSRQLEIPFLSGRGTKTCSQIHLSHLPADPSSLIAYRVSPAVNNPKNTGPSLIAPVTDHGSGKQQTLQL
ncbi:MAG: SOS response-associated peptidase [Methanospirillaceae archaeon]|nr:SOS response-associated peptidase [Methanospirillaceae archaeon]